MARVLSSALDCSSHPPELVCGTVAVDKLGSFSRQHRLNGFRLAPTDSRLRFVHGFCLPDIPTRLHWDINTRPAYLPARPPSRYTTSTGILTCFSIGYGFHLTRIRLTLGNYLYPETSGFGEYVFHIFYRYSCQHNHFTANQHIPSDTPSARSERPLQSPKELPAFML